MMDVYINGIGIVSRCACSKEELETVSSEWTAQYKTLPVDFPIEIPAAKLRRNSRYNKMACAAADQALKDARIPERMSSGMDSHLVGTILSTGYGAVEYNTIFADSVVKGEPNACSPAVFSGSVPNSCVGQICIINKLKGFSTVLAGGDPLEYSALLLKTGRADHILTGSIEEYFPALYEAFKTIEAAKGCDLSEGAAMAVLSREKSENSYCAVTGSAGTNLGSSPFIHCCEEPDEIRKKISGVLDQFSEPDVCFTCANGSWFDQTEEEALKQVFPQIHVRKPKEVFGETLGCGYMMSVLLGACAIHKGEYRRILVSGLDLIGNYFCVMLEKC